MASPCDGCALRLFNDKCYNLKGVGNPHYGRLIVVPNVDYSAYKRRDMSFSSQVDIIKNILTPQHLSTGERDNCDNLDFYIVPFIRCNTTIGCEITDDIIFRCGHYFIQDLLKYDFKDILLLGESTQLISGLGGIKNNLNNLFYTTKNKRKYYVNYNPLIKYIDNEKFDIFCHYLIKWYNAVRTKYYMDYSLKSLMI